jgi:Lysyl oxidase
MTRRRGVLIRLLPATAAAVALGLGAHALAGHAATGVPLLPDLEQEPPGNLVVSRVGSARHHVYWLGFRSAVRNVGRGPLRISGHRFDRGTVRMVADQLIESQGAPEQVVRAVGHLRYVVAPDHRHWHLLHFERYELRRPGSRRALVRDHKTGFCLGDRYAVPDRVLPARAPAPRFTSDCGLGEPALLGVDEGISVGYGDAYAADLEGQYLTLTGLPDGRYDLLHRVNVDRRIRELDYGNDAASTLIDLRWRDGVPHVTVLRTCPDRAAC